MTKMRNEILILSLLFTLASQAAPIPLIESEHHFIKSQNLQTIAPERLLRIKGLCIQRKFDGLNAACLETFKIKETFAKKPANSGIRSQIGNDSWTGCYQDCTDLLGIEGSSIFGMLCIPC